MQKEQAHCQGQSWLAGALRAASWGTLWVRGWGAWLSQPEQAPIREGLGSWKVQPLTPVLRGGDLERKAGTGAHTGVVGRPGPAFSGPAAWAWASSTLSSSSGVWAERRHSWAVRPQCPSHTDVGLPTPQAAGSSLKTLVAVGKVPED